jgi:hypothetical protein
VPTSVLTEGGNSGKGPVKASVYEPLLFNTPLPVRTMGDVIICWPLKSNGEKPKVMLVVTLRAKKSTFIVTEAAFNSAMCKNGIKPPTIHPLPPL